MIKLTVEERLQILSNVDNRKYSVVAVEEGFDDLFNELLGKPLFGDKSQLNGTQKQILYNTFMLLINKLEVKENE